MSPDGCARELLDLSRFAAITNPIQSPDLYAQRGFYAASGQIVGPVTAGLQIADRLHITHSGRYGDLGLRHAQFFAATPRKFGRPKAPQVRGTTRTGNHGGNNTGKIPGRQFRLSPGRPQSTAAVIPRVRPPSLPSVGLPRPTLGGVVRSREFRRLWIADAQSLVGDQLARVALSILVFEQTRSGLATALVYALTFLPAVVGNILLGSLADRFPRRDVLVIGDLARGGLLASMAIPGLALWAVGLLLTIGRPARRAVEGGGDRARIGTRG